MAAEGSLASASIRIEPDRFTMVDFDHDEIAAVVARVADGVGLAGQAILVRIDERTPLSRIKVLSVDPIELSVQGGAFEDQRRVRRFEVDRAEDGVGLHLMQVVDRLDPDFDAPSLDEELSLAHRTAWESYAMGRLVRIGSLSATLRRPAQRQRRLFHFRNRHGFTDSADEAFGRLWSAQGLTWPGIVAISDSSTLVEV